MSRVIVSFFLSLFALACVPNQRIMNSSEGPPAATNVAPAASGFDQELESMRTADFRVIYVFRRKDGGALNNEDKQFASRNIPVEMNRRTLSDSEKAIIVGSNYKIPDENLKILTERFAFEDRSATE